MIKITKNKENFRRNIKTFTWLYLPVEVKDREMLSKLLLAFIAVKNGFGVFIGRNGLNVSRDKFPKGIYFDKCLSVHKVHQHEQQVLQFGNRLVSFDEEGLLFSDAASYARARFSQRSVDLSSLIFLWGPAQAKIFKDNAAVGDKLRITGSLRADLWRREFSSLYKKKSDSIRGRFSPFILIVSNWGYSQYQRDKGLHPDQTYPGFFSSFIRKLFLDLIPKIAAKFPEKTIIVRPHPLELEDYWRERQSHFPSNVKVVKEGAIGPWIHGAEAVIHNNCTTGVEAWIGDVTTIVYSPIVEGKSNRHLYSMPVNDLGIICNSDSEVLATLEKTLRGRNLSIGTSAEALGKSFIFRSEKALAVELMVHHLKDLGMSPQPYQLQNYGLKKKVRAALGEIKWLIKDRLNLSGMYTRRYALEKNPGIELDEVQEQLERFAVHFGERSDLFKVHQVDKDTFCIYGSTQNAALEMMENVELGSRLQHEADYETRVECRTA